MVLATDTPGKHGYCAGMTASVDAWLLAGIDLSHLKQPAAVTPPEPEPAPAPQPVVAEAPFEIALADEDAGDCPDAITLTVRRRDDHADVRTVSRRCRKMTCDCCRRALVRDYLLRAESGVRRALAVPGCTLAAFDGASVSRSAMGKRLNGAGIKLVGYLQCDLGQRRILVCALAADSVMPLGFEPVTMAGAAAKLREVSDLLRHATPFNGAERWRPLSLSETWQGRVSPTRDDQKKDRTNSPEDSQRRSSPEYEAVRGHAVASPQAVAECLRRFGLDPVLRRPRRPGRLQWSIQWFASWMTPAERLDVLVALDALPRDGGPTCADLDMPLPDAEPVTVAGVELSRVESALFVEARAAGSLPRVPLWLPNESLNRLEAACRCEGVAVPERSAVA